MALNENQLKTAIRTAFKTAADAATEKPPADPDATLEKLSADLAKAIHAYLTNGDVVGVEVGVTAAGGVFKQTNNGKVQ